jgi:hypothetical protein
MPRPRTHFSLHPPDVLCGATTTRHRAIKTTDDLACVTCKRCERAANTLRIPKRRPGPPVTESDYTMKTADIIALLHDAQLNDRIDRTAHQAIVRRLDMTIAAVPVAVRALKRKGTKLVWKRVPSTAPMIDLIPTGRVYLLRVEDESGRHLVRAAVWTGAFLPVPPHLRNAHYAVLRP